MFWRAVRFSAAVLQQDSSVPVAVDDAPASAFDLDFRPRAAVHPSPADWRDIVVYQLLLDRFDDGGDRPMYDGGELARGEVDPGIGSTWQGGTIRGATRRLDYLKNLGVGAVWVSPPLKQRPDDDNGYHGYAIQDFLQIDPRFGTTEDFAEFVQQAHDRGIRVIMDVVIDHTADAWGYHEGVTFDGQQHEIAGWHDGGSPGDFGRNQGVWPIEFQRPEAFVRMGPMSDPGSVSGAEAKDGDFMSLKVLDLGHKPTLAAMINCYKYWIAVADVDGFRIDALRHIRHPHASDFCHAIREYALSIGKSDFFLVGEVADSDEEMSRYIGSNVELRPGEAGDDTDPDSTADYPQLNAVIDFFYHRQWDGILRNERPATDAAGRYDYLRDRYRSYGDAGKHYLTFLENHDQGDVTPFRRFLDGTQDDNPDQTRPGGDERLAILGNLVLLTSMGVPCMYYGTEQGFDGGGDSDTFVREAMFGGRFGPFGTGDAPDSPHYFDDSHPIYQTTGKLAKARAAEPTLRYGRQYFRLLGDDPGDPFAYVRVLDVTEIVVAVNPSLDEKQISVPVDDNLNPPGTQLIDLTCDDCCIEVQGDGDGNAWVNLTLGPREGVILRQHVE